MASKLTQFKNDEDRNDFYIALVVILFFLGGGLIVGSKFKDQFFSIPPLAETTDSISTEALATKDDLDLDYQITQNQSDKIDRWAEEVKTDHNTVPNKIKRLKPKVNLQSQIDNDLEYSTKPESLKELAENDTREALKASELESEFFEEEEEEEVTQENIEPKIKKEVKTPPTVITKTDRNTVAEVKKTITPVTKSTANTSPKSHSAKQPGCLIMLGAFSHEVNANRLIQNLKKDRYQIFTRVKNGLTTVGIQAPCQGESLDLLMNEMKENYNQKAYFVDDK